MVSIQIILKTDFDRVRAAGIALPARLGLLADMCRLNTLAGVKRAGSGHLGSSFSAMDIVTWLYCHRLNTVEVGFGSPDRDVYFSSKGHDVPGLYAMLFALGVLPLEKFLKLRRLGGMDGHPDVGVPGVEANSGSLGMGISKGKGIAWAKRRQGLGGRVVVMTGDGELQEGQNFEALQTAAHHHLSQLTVIVDHNKVQSDKPVAEIIDLGDMEQKLGSFGWEVARCDGHDFAALEQVFERFERVTDRPQLLIADTIKGRGVSFMEHPVALREGQGLYRWHAGAPPDDVYLKAHAELYARINTQLTALGLPAATLYEAPPEISMAVGAANALGGEPLSRGKAAGLPTAVSDEYVADVFGQTLVALAAERPDLVVLDGDLSADCRVRAFENTYPERFLENGIAEQDMVSTAGGLARHGLLPVVNSFASFLAARANEQIYNNASERTKIIYACHYAGLIPAGPGKSHQSIRDISLLGALPNMIILQPANAEETRQAVAYCVNTATENCALRLIIGPSPRRITLPADYSLTYGQGVTVAEGGEALLFAYGPVMLHEALTAHTLLAARGFGLQVVNMPWLNRVDPAWLADCLAGHRHVYVLEDHSPVGGLGDCLLSIMAANDLLAGRSLAKFAVEGYPACGTPQQALAFHRLDGASLAERLLRAADAPADGH
jgi:transketolase